MPSRRWSGTVNSSRRENTSLTGRRAARASAATWASKCGSHLPPKPPPSSGTITRTLDSGSCSVWATVLRAGNGTWVDDQIVTWSPSHCAITACGSIGAACDMSAT